MIKKREEVLFNYLIGYMKLKSSFMSFKDLMVEDTSDVIQNFMKRFFSGWRYAKMVLLLEKMVLPLNF